MDLEEKEAIAISENNTRRFRKSIYYNANPSHLNRVDLLDIMPNMEDTVIQQLMAYKNFQLELFVPTAQIPKFTHLFYKQKQQQHLFGQQELAIGFPFFFEQKEATALAQCAAPLFLFPVQLEHSKSRVDAWYLKAIENRSPIPNYALLDLFEQGGYPARLSGLMRTFLEYGEFSPASFKNLLVDLEILLRENDADRDSVRLKPFPSTTDLQNSNRRFNFGKHLVLGHFPTNDLAVLKNKRILSDKEKTTIASNKYDFFPMVNDSDQDFALRTSIKTKVNTIKGLKGTGKTYLAANLALNALLNGKKVVYISPKKSGRASFAQHLSSAGMGQKVMEWTNPVDFAHQTVSMLRAVQAITSKAAKVNTSVFDTHYKEYHRLRALDDNQHRLLHEPLIEGMTWNAMIGQHLFYKRVAEKDDISGFVDGSIFDYQASEYEKLQSTVDLGEQHYAEVVDSDSIIYNIHVNNFVPFEMDRAAQSMLKDKLLYFQHELQKLLQSCLDTEKQYNQSVQNVLLISYKQLKKRVEDLKHKINSAENLHGELLWNASTFFSSFSKKKTAIKTLRQEFTEDIKQLYAAFVACDDFENVPTLNDFDDFKSIPNKLKEMENALEKWHITIPKIVHKKSAELENTSLFPREIDQNEHRALYQSTADFIDEVITAEVFISIPFEAKSNTQQLSKQLESLFQYCKKMESIIAQEFIAFFPWRKLWFEAEKKEQLVLQALIDAKAKNWLACSSKWYLEQRMSSEAPIVPLDDKHQKSLEGHVQYLQTHYKNLISNLWQDKRTSALKKLKKANKKCSDFVFKKNKSVTQNDIVQLEDFFLGQIENLLEVFPVFICSPDFAAQHLVSNGNVLSDYFILDDAHCVSDEKGSSLFDLGKQQYIISDALSNGTDEKLSYSKLAEAEHFKLSYVHQSTIERDIAEKYHLSKGDFMSNQIQYKWLKVNGQFETANGTNPIEIQAMLQFLYEMEERELKSYKVAIVCSTDAQKNLLEEKLLLIKTKRAIGSSRVQQLEVHNSLSIHTFETLPLIKADIVLFSTTFNHASQVHTKSGLSKVKSFLYDLIVLADKQTIFIHSFEQNFNGINEFATQLSRLWLSESEALLLESSEKQEKAGNFLFETYRYLQAYFDKGRLTIEHAYSNIAPKSILVTPKFEGQVQHLVLFDRVASQHPTQSSRWENNITEGMKLQGVEIIHTNSYDWWLSPEEEARNVAIKVVVSDKKYNKALKKKATLDILNKEEEIQAMLEGE